MAKKLPEGESPEGELLIDRMADTPLLSLVEEIALGWELKLLKGMINDGDSSATTALQYKAARDKMFYANIRLVLEIANKMHRLDYMDQVQLGSIGLWRATELFDVERGNRFSTYATWWIRQAIMRGADETDSTIRLPVHIRDVLRDIRRAENAFFQANGREPSIEELSRLTGHNVEKLKRVFGFLEHPRSLSEMLSTDDGDGNPRTHFVADHTDTEAEYVESDATARLRAIVNGALEKLERYVPEGDNKPRYERHTRVLRLRFRIGESYTADEEPFRTLQQVGDEMGITRERARQLQKDAVKWLKANCPELRELLDRMQEE